VWLTTGKIVTVRFGFVGSNLHCSVVKVELITAKLGTISTTGLGELQRLSLRMASTTGMQTPPRLPSPPPSNGSHGTTRILRKTSNSSQASSEGGVGERERYTPRRVSISKASNLTVALSGGNPKSKSGTLRRKSNSVFAAFRDSFVAIDDGDLTFQVREDDVDNREVYSLLAIREVRLTGVGSSQFNLKLAEQPAATLSERMNSTSSGLMSSLIDFGASKTRNVVLKASSSEEAMEWIAIIKHELKNQILVCKNLISTLQSEGHEERAEPLFEQMIELLRVVYDGKEHFEVADSLRSYGRWLENQGRSDEAAMRKRQAKAIKRRCEEGLDTTLSRNSGDIHESTVEEIRRYSESSNRLPPLRKN